MLKLTNVEKSIKFECDILGYESPDAKDNWLLVRVIVIQGNQRFEKVDGALETRDLLLLGEWFECLSENCLPRYAWLNFTEPCLSFQFLACYDNKVRISIHLSHNLKPNFKIKQFNFKSSNWDVVFELERKDLEKAIAGVKEASSLYPIRRRR